MGDPRTAPTRCRSAAEDLAALHVALGPFGCFVNVVGTADVVLAAAAAVIAPEVQGKSGSWRPLEATESLSITS
jgi:hypothetical protein